MTVSIFNALTVVAVGFLFVVAFVVDRLRARVKELERRFEPGRRVVRVSGARDSHSDTFDADGPWAKPPAMLGVRPAGSQWGCAFDGCLEAARVVITGKGSVYRGACADHVKAVKKIARVAA